MNLDQNPSRRAFLLRAAGAAMLAAHAPFLARASDTVGMIDPASPAPLPLLFLRLQTTRLEAQKRFYRDILGLPISLEDASSFCVSAGRTAITFEMPFVLDAPATPPFYHFAFNIPENRLEQALQWIKSRVPVIQNAMGRETYHFESWNAHALYFLDPSGNIVEFIARHTLPNASPRDFGPDDIGDVSEIGLVTPAVAPLVDELHRSLGVAPYLGKRSDDFTAVGDERGLLIVVRTARPWFPLENEASRPASIFPTYISTYAQVSGGNPRLDGLPYIIESGC